MHSFVLHSLSFARNCGYCLHGRTKFTCGIHNIVDSVCTKVSLFDTNRYLSELLKTGRIDEARKVFDGMPQRDEFTWNTMIVGYSNSGRLGEARQLFDETPKKSAITWSTLISGFSKYGYETESFQLFWQMQYAGHMPSQFTLGSILRMCSIKGLLSRGEQVHCHVIKTFFDRDDFVVTGLIHMYAKCLCVMEAEYLFEKMSKGKNHVTWTAMINGYSLNGDVVKAIECFRSMRAEGVETNQYTFPGVLTACGEVLDLGFGRQVHGSIVRGGFGANVFVQSALVDMYIKCGDLSSARNALELMEVDDTVSWNIMLVGYVRQRLVEDAVVLFKLMRAKSMEPDDFTYPSVLNLLASIRDGRNGKSVHCMIIKTGFQDHKHVSNALIDMYAKQNNSDCAYKVFKCMVDKDVISWTSLVTGFALNGCYEEALKLFCQMRVAGVDTDEIVTANVLSSCGKLTLLDYGQQIHADLIKRGLAASLSVCNSLLTVYADCGCLEDADRIFYSMEVRHVITWTALIVGYAQNGRGKEALPLYDEMVASGTKPDFITFIGLLFACSHAGLVEQGYNYFESMVKVHGIRPGPDHYACMIDLLGRSGRMQEAEELLRKMDVQPDASVWKALLSACRVHRNIDLAKRAAAALFELEPRDAVPYVMLANIYSAIGKWKEAAEVRRLMKSRGINKEPGCSWMELNSKVYTFLSDDRHHLYADKIYAKIDEIIILIKEAGYIPDINFDLHDINDEGKEHGVSYHSEKLAVSFGLLYVPQGVPIRIYKNLRVCGDCHAAMKYISKVYQRRIVLRDSNCFHHFREGICSCGDYW